MDTKIARGQILKDLRIYKKLNQTYLANMLEISLTAYQKYEHGTAEPNFDNLLKLADFYDVTTDYLLGREPLQYSIEEQELIKKYNKLDDYGKQVANNTIEHEIERQDEDTRNIAAAFRIYIDYKEKYGSKKAIELMEYDPFVNLDLRDEEEKEVLAKYMSLPPQIRAVLLDALRQLGGVIIDESGKEQPALMKTTEDSKRVTKTAGELEDQLKAEQEAEKDGEKFA